MWKRVTLIISLFMISLIAWNVGGETSNNECWEYYNRTSCDSAFGCIWQVDGLTKPYCDLDWFGTNCWEYDGNESVCNNREGCSWFSEFGGEWCGPVFEQCYLYYNTEPACNDAPISCEWYGWGGGGKCQPACHNKTISSSECKALSGCIWIAEPGWCGEDLSCVDLDSDGYGVGNTTDCKYEEVDCNDNNSNINPGAVEICDFVDNDCDGILETADMCREFECHDKIDNDLDGFIDMKDQDCSVRACVPLRKLKQSF